MADHEPTKPIYAAINAQAFTAEGPVVLACEKHGEIDQRRMVALTPTEARWLYDEGRLTGWEPGGEVDR